MACNALNGTSTTHTLDANTFQYCRIWIANAGLTQSCTLVQPNSGQLKLAQTHFFSIEVGLSRKQAEVFYESFHVDHAPDICPPPSLQKSKNIRKDGVSKGASHSPLHVFRFTCAILIHVSGVAWFWMSVAMVSIYYYFTSCGNICTVS